MALKLAHYGACNSLSSSIKVLCLILICSFWLWFISSLNDLPILRSVWWGRGTGIFLSMENSLEKLAEDVLKLGAVADCTSCSQSSGLSRDCCEDTVSEHEM